MKSIEETKRALQICGNPALDHCNGCPFEGDEDCSEKNRDALAYIQQLERERDELLQKNQQLERERDAAVEDLETMGEDMAYCDTCLHNNTNSKEEPCSSCMSGYLINNWQWRGVQEVE